MEKAIVVNRQVLTSRPQAALMVHSVNGYTVCVIPAAFSVVAGQELYRQEHYRGVWRVSGSNDLFPANITGAMTLDEAVQAFEKIISM